eukprot:3067214-Lingulodinium_polyedra.AAC.1
MVKCALPRAIDGAAWPQRYFARFAVFSGPPRQPDASVQLLEECVGAPCCSYGCLGLDAAQFMAGIPKHC